jgi:transcriptional regulator with XRE-family HTH domain
VARMDNTQLRRIRKRLKLTQAQFAERIGIAPNSLARLERGERAITEPLARLIRLLAAPAARPDSDGKSADWPKRTRDIDAITGKPIPRRRTTRKGGR